jgi:hypothetical protein
VEDIQSIHWLSFLIGALVAWVLEWALDFFYWRRKWARTPEVVEVEVVEVEEG